MCRCRGQVNKRIPVGLPILALVHRKQFAFRSPDIRLADVRIVTYDSLADVLSPVYTPCAARCAARDSRDCSAQALRAAQGQSARAARRALLFPLRHLSASGLAMHGLRPCVTPPPEQKLQKLPPSPPSRSSMDSPWYPSENARWTPVTPFPRPVLQK